MDKREEKKFKKKTWLELKPEEIKKLEAKSACMYGRKSSVR